MALLFHLPVHQLRLVAETRAPCVALPALVLVGLLGAAHVVVGQPAAGSPAVTAAEAGDRDEVATAERAEEAPGQETPDEAAPSRDAPDVEELEARLPDEHREWLRSVFPLISEEERLYFLGIEEGYRREAFMRRFWEVRDPDSLTRFNELRVRWEEHVEEVSILFPFEDARALVYLLNGPPGRWQLPDGRVVGRCYSRSDELELWFYGGSERTPRWFPVILLKRGNRSPYEVWRSGLFLEAVPRYGLPTRNVKDLCADELLPYAMSFIRNDVGYEQLLEEVLTPPRPPEEWLATFASMSTDLPEGVATFEADLELEYPGRNQNRTAVQAVLTVPREQATAREFDGKSQHHFLLVGEVVRDDHLFETFRYRFELPEIPEVAVVPLVFTRYLRPGPALLNVKVEDLYADRFARVSVELDIPSPEGRSSVRPEPDSEVFQLLREATEAAARGERILRLIPPGEDQVHVGLLRFETQAVGEFEKVTFFLDDRPILSKKSPPYSVELNLGSIATTHRLRAAGYFEGREVAADEIRVNQGGQRFRVYITEPRSDRKYEHSLTAMVQVETPDDQPIDRLELYLNEERLATLYQPPYVQSLLIPGSELAYVRAVAFLPDGSSTEDVAFVNSPDYLEEMEVQYVELHALVVNDAGRPILRLPAESFRVLEDGEPQEIRRFEYVQDLPIHAGLLLDTSASMEGSLVRVAEAALRFTEGTIEAKDRLCLVSFAGRPSIEVRFTNDSEQVERALAGLVPRGSTALYDSLVYALTYFDGVKGQKALLLLSDGKDESSSFDYEAALEVARRSGVIVYAIGLRGAAKDKGARKVLEEIAEETGGRAYFIEELSELDGIYDAIQEELRSRYLIAYQSASRKDASEFRVVRVEVDEKGAEARTMSGYYP